MSKSGPRLEQAQLLAALSALEKAGVAFRGPFASSKGNLIVVERTILKQSELVDLHARGQLTREGIQKFVKGHKAKRAGA